MKKILEYIIKFNYYHILILLSAVFFVLYSFLAYNSPYQYNSPDEQSNFFFIQHYIENGNFRFHEPANNIVKNLVRPRSTGVIGEYIVPGGFLGLIAFLAIVAKYIGIWVVPYIIPLISALTPILFFYVIKRIFDKRVALLSSLLLYIHPAFWYFSSRSLFPNILQVNILILSLAILASASDYQTSRYKRFLLFFIGGMSGGIALGIRLNEIIWVVPLFFLLSYLWKSYYTFKDYVFVLLGGVIGIIPILYLNLITYGSPVFTGYFEVNTMISQAGESVRSFTDALWFIVLPFGFHIKNILKNLINYQLRIFSFITPLIVIVVVYLLWNIKRLTRKIWSYLGVYIIMIAILGIYYGSWKFNDHPDPRAISIGTSYIRYWLPLYIISLPLIAWVLLEIKKSIDKYFYNKLQKNSESYTMYGILVIVILLLVHSFNIVYLSTDESLQQVKTSIEVGVSDAQEVINHTQNTDIIIVDYDDKYLFPHRKVVVPFRNEYNQNAIPELLQNNYNVYYFGLTLPPVDLDFIHENTFNALGIQMISEVRIQKKTLYKFK